MHLNGVKMMLKNSCLFWKVKNYVDNMNIQYGNLIDHTIFGDRFLRETATITFSMGESK